MVARHHGVLPFLRDVIALNGGEEHQISVSAGTTLRLFLNKFGSLSNVTGDCLPRWSPADLNDRARGVPSSGSGILGNRTAIPGGGGRVLRSEGQEEVSVCRRQGPAAKSEGVVSRMVNCLSVVGRRVVPSRPHARPVIGQAGIRFLPTPPPPSLRSLLVAASFVLFVILSLSLRRTRLCSRRKKARRHAGVLKCGEGWYGLEGVSGGREKELPTPSTYETKAGGGKREIADKTHRPVASPDTIPTYENLGATLPGIDPVRLGVRRDKIDVKHLYTEADFAIGSQFIRHALDDSEPIADLQGNK
ncbi:hypothetical protein PR048_008237 [Dryococelus australis]|uniref:Uncharacterized protein n=1 Tax=Dryococelus australis TaxID=614101 RepID=A0ABQ9HXF9_9NEOP|nr:hypothetical protein PR048_008237 [Dryococelus australis]